MKKKKLLAGLLLSAALSGGEPKRLFVDPASRWISIHDQEGKDAPNEFTRHLAHDCPGIAVTDDKASADFAVSFSRSGVSAGSVVIFSGGKMVNSFKPGHSATLRKMAGTVCESLK